MVTRMGATYTALGPRTRPTRFSDRPAWMQEIIDREEQEQQDAHERETRTGRHHPFLLALAERERVAQEALDAARRREDQAHRTEERAADDDSEQDQSRQGPAAAAERADTRPDPDPTTQGRPQRESQGVQPDPL